MSKYSIKWCFITKKKFLLLIFLWRALVYEFCHKYTTFGVFHNFLFYFLITSVDTIVHKSRAINLFFFCFFFLFFFFCFFFLFFFLFCHMQLYIQVQFKTICLDKCNPNTHLNSLPILYFLLCGSFALIILQQFYTVILHTHVFLFEL